MYEFILEKKLLTALSAILIALSAGWMVGAGRLWFRGFFYSFAPSFAAAFYAVAFLAQPRLNPADLIAGLLFEVVVLALFLSLLVKLVRDIRFISERDAIGVLKWSIFLQLAVVYPNMNLAGFGLFSEGTRIAYLSSSWFAKYYTYAGFIISAIQATFLASLVSVRGYLGLCGWSIVAANLVLSVVAGSKGGVFLWLLSAASLIDYKRARIPNYKILFAIFIGLGTVWMSSFIISRFLNIQLVDFFEIVFSRFFLNNDARALALELRTSQTAEFSFFSEGFRSLGTLLGLPARNDPLGVVLFEEGLSITNGGGANSSFMALSTYYFPAGYALLPALLGIIGAISLKAINQLTSKLFFSPTNRAIATSMWITLLLCYSQDFLSFQIMAPIVILVVCAIWVSQRKFHISAKQ